MFQFVKRTASLVLANSIVVAADQYLRSTVEGIVRDRRHAKQVKRERALDKR